MDFRTAIKPAPATIRVDHSSGIMMLGSCFSDNIGRRLLDGLFDVDVNPMGTLYNPASIASALDDIMERREFAAADLFEHDGRWHSFAHHSRFSGTEPLLRVFCEMDSVSRAAETARCMEGFLGLEGRNIE